ncbi:class I SAM-dependent methyltransferase [Jannaschia sp. 2305UL9-9]|uniref:class I SAM-dependent DNA methyltransferase n=1 Tax=Jannaschia sp. 2305UL9-9 TaxID=3121638 RepID=UPI0035274678
MTDAQTLSVYADRANDYAAMGQDTQQDWDTFVAALPPVDGPVLDWGCGPGHDAEAFAGMGLAVEATDATPEMVALACAKGVTARLETFDALDPAPRFRGIWANFSLLHASGADLPVLIRRAASALLPGGVLHLGMKRGQGTQRDSLGRRYTYVEAGDLDRLTAEAGLQSPTHRTGRGIGLSGHVAGYIIHRSVKP